MTGGQRLLFLLGALLIIGIFVYWAIVLYNFEILGNP